MLCFVFFLSLQYIFIVPLTIFIKPTLVMRIVSVIFFKTFKVTGYNALMFLKQNVLAIKEDNHLKDSTNFNREER